MGAIKKLNDQEINELTKRLFGGRGFESLTLRRMQKALISQCFFCILSLQNNFGSLPKSNL